MNTHPTRGPATDADGDVAAEWTVDDAAALLDPPMTVEEVRALIIVVGLPAAGTRPAGRKGGRPAKTYRQTDVLKAHAAVASLLAERERTA